MSSNPTVSRPESNCTCLTAGERCAAHRGERAFDVEVSVCAAGSSRYSSASVPRAINLAVVR